MWVTRGVVILPQSRTEHTVPLYQWDVTSCGVCTSECTHVSLGPKLCADTATKKRNSHHGISLNWQYLKQNLDLLGYVCTLFHDTTAPSGPGSPHYRVFTITLSKSLLDKWRARHRDLYLTTHKTHKRHVSMPPTRFEAAIPVSERSQTHALERAATGTGRVLYTPWIN